MSKKDINISMKKALEEFNNNNCEINSKEERNNVFKIQDGFSIKEKSDFLVFFLLVPNKKHKNNLN